MRKPFFLYACIVIGLPLFWGAFTAAQDPAPYLEVTGPCRLSFPEDHGPHPGFKTEWWYYTGNLTSNEGRRFGFQLTFFRSQLSPPGEKASWPTPASAWRAENLILGHAAISDLYGGRFLHARDISREVLGIAGTGQKSGTTRVFLKKWSMTLGEETHRLIAATDDFSFDLTLTPVKSPVLHGDHGYSQKGTAPERASCYYSFTRLDTRGTLTLGEKSFPVNGQSWMDHEFSTAPLEPDLAGWDWFSLQLSDHTEVMIYLLRNRSGGLHPASSGSFVDAEGAVHHLEKRQMEITVSDRWESGRTGATYPSAWKIRITPFQLDLNVTSNLPDQEMADDGPSGVVYWEGSVSLDGTASGKPVNGQGYVELTGYAGEMEVLK